MFIELNEVELLGNDGKNKKLWTTIGKDAKFYGEQMKLLQSFFGKIKNETKPIYCDMMKKITVERFGTMVQYIIQNHNQTYNSKSFPLPAVFTDAYNRTCVPLEQRPYSPKEYDDEQMLDEDFAKTRAMLKSFEIDFIAKHGVDPLTPRERELEENKEGKKMRHAKRDAGLVYSHVTKTDLPKDEAKLLGTYCEY